jgi:hypothetical protein
MALVVTIIVVGFLQITTTTTALNTATAVDISEIVARMFVLDAVPSRKKFASTINVVCV